MYKKLLAIAILVCSIPVMANAAWMFNTLAKTGGGTIDSRNMAGQRSTNGTVFGVYTTHATLPITVTADNNYSITKIVLNGVTINNPVSPYTLATVSGGAGANTAQSLSATFQAGIVPLTASVSNSAGGSVTPTSVANIYYGPTYAPINFKFIPKAGYSVSAITGTAGFTVSSALPAAVGTTVTVTIPTGTNLASAVNLVGTFATSAVIAKAVSPQTVLTGATVTLDASSSLNATSYVWTQLSGPAVTLTPTTLGKATFPAAVAGIYQFQVVATGAAGSSAANATVTATGLLTDAARNQCINCHNQNNVGGAGTALVVLANWSASGHKANAHGPKMCDGCHAGANSGGHPGALACASCHGATVSHAAKATAGATGTACGVCHVGARTQGNDAHAMEEGCIDCHSVQLNAGGAYVQDNSGVRAIVSEFSKRSHHITGAAPTNAQCIVCHMEGKGSAYGVHIDSTYHMKDNKIYLRDADTNLPIEWSGTEHTNMDNFCFSCHDSNGAAGFASSSATLVPGTSLMSATNPFGDTLTNSYDQVTRTGVVDVKTAFTTTNASHHAVSGQRYTYRFSTAANAAAWAARTGNPVPAASEIAEGHDVGTGVSPFGTGLTFDPAGPEEGGEATLFEGGKFVSTYIPLGASKNVADNSTLHCGDCHTVGQWKSGSSTNADGSTTTVAIGAHGSANEYLLRNSLGTDALHNSLTYVCFNCHISTQEVSSPALWAELVAEGKILPSNNAIPNGGTSAAKYVGTYQNIADGLPGVSVPVSYNGTLVPSWKAGWGSLHPTIIAGQFYGYAVSHAVSAMHAQCLADSAASLGAARANAAGPTWLATGVVGYDYLPTSGATAAAPAAGSDGAGSGNITGIACTNCHNSGLRSGFGGIHGGNNTYTDGLGRTQTTYRFMPGMGNYRYAPPGGWNGKDVSDPTLLTANNPLTYGGPANGASTGFPGASGKPIGGCYTNGAADLNTSGGVTYGSCSHHGTSTASSGQTVAGGTTVNGVAITLRASYGGGTTSSTTTYEPTVREATAGGALVTRPLKY
jgi:hypothetical protein